MILCSKYHQSDLVQTLQNDVVMVLRSSFSLLWYQSCNVDERPTHRGGSIFSDLLDRSR